MPQTLVTSLNPAPLRQTLNPKSTLCVQAGSGAGTHRNITLRLVDTCTPDPEP